MNGDWASPDLAVRAPLARGTWTDGSFSFPTQTTSNSGGGSECASAGPVTCSAQARDRSPSASADDQIPSWKVSTMV